MSRKQNAHNEEEEEEEEWGERNDGTKKKNLEATRRELWVS